MKDFELTVLFRPDLDELELPLDMVRRLITDHGGEIVKEESDGKKRLSYKIGEYEYAVYYFFVLRLPTDTTSEISSTLNITDEVLRYLLVTVDSGRQKKHISE